MSNTWGIYLLVRNTGEKSPTRPHTLPSFDEGEESLSLERRQERTLRPISWLVG